MSANNQDWNRLSPAWDAKMGDSSNRWHRELILPKTLEMLELKASDVVLEIGCGNGAFANGISEYCGKVIATDFSDQMIQCAKKRFGKNEKVEFLMADATSYQAIASIQPDIAFTKIVSNMAIMDISDIEPMFKAVSERMGRDGLFVFSSIHPCFQNPGMRKLIEIDDYNERKNVKKGITIFDYIEERTLRTRILANDSSTVEHYHRPISVISRILKKNGLIIDTIEEPVFVKSGSDEFEWDSIPPVIIYKAKKAR